MPLPPDGLFYIDKRDRTEKACVPPWDPSLVPDINVERLLAGRGAYGEVALGMWGDKAVAIKREKMFSLGAEHAKRIFREMCITRHLCSPLGISHPNLVPLLDVRAGVCPLPRPDAFVSLVMPNAGRALSSLLRDVSVVLTLPEVRDLAWQLLQALHFMHTAGFMHRDVKSDNVLVERLPSPEMGGARTWHLRVCDLGLARSARAEGVAPHGADAAPKAAAFTAGVLSANYRPLEISVPHYSSDTRHDCYYDGCAVDVFSAAAVIAEMFEMMDGDGAGRRVLFREASGGYEQYCATKWQARNM
jgi:serine/threonine protein kinase